MKIFKLMDLYSNQVDEVKKATYLAARKHFSERHSGTHKIQWENKKLGTQDKLVTFRTAVKTATDSREAKHRIKNLLQLIINEQNQEQVKEISSLLERL
jgi:hypothetical protein